MVERAEMENQATELGNRLLEFKYINSKQEEHAFALRAYAVRHFAEHDDGTALIADILGGFTHVTMKYDALCEMMAEYDRFIEIRLCKAPEGGVGRYTADSTQRCSVRALNICWYGQNPEFGSVIVDYAARAMRVASTFDEIKRLLEGM